jgi:hypothetical protein
MTPIIDHARGRTIAVGYARRPIARRDTVIHQIGGNLALGKRPEGESRNIWSNAPGGPARDCQQTGGE